jgi:tripartite ATP-independent transporter DctM subunit
MMGGIYIVYVIVRTQLNPSLAPVDESIAADMPFRERLVHARGIIPPVLLVFVVLGSIYGGVTSITEAAGIGVVGSLIIIAIRRELNWKMFNEALAQTFRSSGTILWVTFGATILAGAYNLAGGPAYVANLIIGLDLPPFGVILAMMAIFLLLGMFMDWIGIVLLAMPVFLPIVVKLGYDPIWFGILFCINMQVSFLSPPFGPAAFYLKSVAPPEISLIDIYKSFGPFICLQLLVLALVLFFPWLAMALL